jgi:hypothetical protein
MNSRADVVRRTNHFRATKMAKKAKSEAAPLLASTLKRPVDAKAIVIQVKPEGWRALRHLAVDLETSVQKLGVEALNDLLAKHGRKGTVESAWD